MSKSLVSVIIPTYNRSKFLKDAILSVVNQTYSNIEILVIDDGSDTNYAEAICKQFQNCDYYRKDNGGISSARNYGIEKAKGDFIAFLDDDDLWGRNKLEKQLQLFSSKKDIDLVHSAAEVIDENGTSKGEIIGASKGKEHQRSGYVFWNALGTWLVKSPTPLIRKKVFENGLRFDESIKAGEDLDFYNRLFYKHKIHYISDALAYYRFYNDASRLSTHSDKYIGLEWKIYTNLIKMGISNPIIKNRIAAKLLKQVVNKHLIKEENSSLKLSTLDKLFKPIKILKQLSDNERRI